jgi:hypothetical protein
LEHEEFLEMTLIEILTELPEKERNEVIEHLDEGVILEISASLGGIGSTVSNFARTALATHGAKLANPAVGAAIGGGVGAVGSAAVWAKKRLALRGKMKQCDSLPPEQAQECKAKVQQEISELGRKALKYGAAATAAGAGIGAGASALEGGRQKAVATAAKERQGRMLSQVNTGMERMAATFAETLPRHKQGVESALARANQNKDAASITQAHKAAMTLKRTLESAAANPTQKAAMARNGINIDSELSAINSKIQGIVNMQGAAVR